jgi:hypothetical protein
LQKAVRNTMHGLKNGSSNNGFMNGVKVQPNVTQRQFSKEHLKIPVTPNLKDIQSEHKEFVNQLNLNSTGNNISAQVQPGGALTNKDAMRGGSGPVTVVADNNDVSITNTSIDVESSVQF